MRIQKNQTETGNFRILKELCEQNYFYLRFNRKCCYYTANIGRFQYYVNKVTAVPRVTRTFHKKHNI